MLKLIHVQARLNVSKGAATVNQMNANEPADAERAGEIIALFQEALSQNLTRDELYDNLNEYIGVRLDYREIDGLAKVICDSFATFAPDNLGLMAGNSSNRDTEVGPTNSSTINFTHSPIDKSLDSPTENSENSPAEEEETNYNLTAFRLAVWKEAARPEYYPFRNAGLTVALKPGVQSLRRAAAAHDEELLGRLLPQEKRTEILQNAAHTCGYNLQIPAADLKTSMLFSDLPGRQRLVALKPELNVENLLNRYNIELLRGVLYLAPRLRITVRDKYKDLFKFIKLFGLMHELKPIPFETKAEPAKKGRRAKIAEPEEVAPTLSEGEIGGYEIILEGASSPFLARSDRRYGIQFAKFLPALLLCEADWKLEAELIFNSAGSSVRAGDEANGTAKKTRLTRALYTLGPQPQLRTHFKGSGEFDSLLEQDFYNAFEERFKTTSRKPASTDDELKSANSLSQAGEDTETETEKVEETPKKRKSAKAKVEGERQGWTIKREDRIIPVFDTVMIPDFAFENSDGRRALLEIVGFWERGYLERKIAKLNRAGRSDIIVLVSERTRCGKENFLVKGQEPPYQLIFFKGTPRLGPIMEALERCAV